ncbi:hypothetical protein F4815DRAFT_501186 [Daldinia loculata]|nr:hypothetical protein F4815DRAFT_501186 [Daldinia loculata]
MAYNNNRQGDPYDDIYDVSDGSDVADEEVYNTFNQLNLTNNAGTSQGRDFNSWWRQNSQDNASHTQPPQPSQRNFGGQRRQPVQKNPSQGRDFSSWWRQNSQDNASQNQPPQPSQRNFGSQWRQPVQKNPSQERDFNNSWRQRDQRTKEVEPEPEPEQESIAGPSRNTGNEQVQPRPRPVSKLIQHGRSTPGYPRWRRTQNETDEIGRVERWGRSNRRPATAFPVTLRPRMARVDDETKNRIQTRGKWYMESLMNTSRYYVREPSERMPVSQGEEHEPYDLMIVLKNAHRLQEPEDFVDAIMRELSNTGEYSRDRGATDNPATGEKNVRRMHANTTAWGLLEDFDLILAELHKLQIELETSNRGNAADRLFSSIAEAYDWNVEELRKSGFHQEIMTYVGSTMMGRLRYMRDHYRKERGPVTHGVRDLLDETSITLSTRYFSAFVHSASMSDDVRAVEWFSNWAVHFPGRHNREFPTPQLDSATAIGLFETVYKIKYEHAVRLLSDAGFAEDVEVIDGFLSYKGTIESTEPARHHELANLVQQYFTPYQVAATTNPEGWQQNGRRITPKLRESLEDLDHPPRYRKFFPKTVEDIPEDGPIYAKNITRKFHDQRHIHTGGWDRKNKYPIRLHESYDPSLGGEGIKFVQPWEVPQRPGEVSQGPGQVPRRLKDVTQQPLGGGQASMALAERSISDKGGKRKREDDDEGLLGDLLSALHTARKTKR